jgi:hypothetical protein
MNLTKKEKELLKLIHKAEETGESIRFHDNLEEIDTFKEKYNGAFVLLRDKQYITGGIDTFCELNLTKKGEDAIKLINEGKRNWEKISVIVGIAGLVLGFIYWLFEYCGKN